MNAVEMLIPPAFQPHNMPDWLVTAPIRAAMAASPLESGRVWLDGQRTLMDEVFYEVREIRPDERLLLDSRVAPEGSLLLVPPRDSVPLRVFDSLTAFINGRGIEAKALVLAGVGSSALGAAALARNVADAIGAPAVAVVCGDGMRDIVSEGMGGWFWFGWRNRLYHLGQQSGALGGALMASLLSYSPAMRLDVDATAELIAHPQMQLELIVGHSKGNLVLWDALRSLPDTGPFTTPIVTLSARIAMPDRCTHIIDVIGARDTLGELNSHPDIKPDVVLPDTGHHTSDDPISSQDPSSQWFASTLRVGKAINVTQVLRDLKQQGKLDFRSGKDGTKRLAAVTVTA